MAVLRLLLTSIAVTALVSDGAAAADMAPLYKAPPALALYNWSGFYLGGNAGYSVGRDPTSATKVNTNNGDVLQRETFALAPAGWLGGFQLGYNWQVGHAVFGVEADWQWTGQRDQACVFSCLDADLFAGPFRLTEEHKLNWFATVRGRFGYAADHWLWYVTGGVAFARIDSNRLYVNGPGTLNPLIPTTVVASNASFNRAGFALGTGVETALAGNWTAKVEYLLVNLGNVTDSFGAVDPPTLGPGAPVSITHTSHIRDHIIRVGLNYRFGGGDVDPARSAAGGFYKAPRAVSPPPYSWAGVYLGGNIGYGLARNPATATVLAVANIGPPVLNQESFTLAPEGWLGGGQIGFNWQTGRIVLGAEADWQWSGQQDTACVNSCTTNGGTIILAQKLSSFATVRGRIGYAADAWLWYVTGGVAWGRVANAVTFPPFGGFSFDQSKYGWVAGAGVETALWGNWTAKLEYLYMDLGGATGSANFVINPPLAIVVNVAGTTTFRDHIFRAGLNYKFGGPVVAAY
jgi:outer membrane immunogenic protein